MKKTAKKIQKAIARRETVAVKILANVKQAVREIDRLTKRLNGMGIAAAKAGANIERMLSAIKAK